MARGGRLGVLIGRWLVCSLDKYYEGHIGDQNFSKMTFLP